MKAQPLRAAAAADAMAALVAVVTGVGKADGIGLEIVRGLASAAWLDPKTTITVVSTARDEAAGSSVVRSLNLPNVVFRQLDITSDDSVKSFKAWVDETFGRGIDILVNNAGE